MRGLRTYGVAGGLLVALTLPFLLAQVGPSGGLPSKPRFNSIGVGVVAPSTGGDISQAANRNSTLQTIIDNDSNGTGNAARVAISSGDGSVALFSAGSGRTSVVVTNGPTGAQGVLRTLGTHPLVFGTNNTLALTISGSQVADFVNTPTVAGTALYESGTFTASFGTACTTTPTVTFDYQRVGNIVTVATVGSSGFPCTGDSTSFDTVSAAMPASIRPTAGGGTSFGSPVTEGFTDNSAATWGIWLFETDGSVRVAKCATHGAACSATGWTAALNRNVPAGPKAFTYMLGDP